MHYVYDNESETSIITMMVTTMMVTDDWWRCDDDEMMMITMTMWWWHHTGSEKGELRSDHRFEWNKKKEHSTFTAVEGEIMYSSSTYIYMFLQSAGGKLSSWCLWLRILVQHTTSAFFNIPTLFLLSASSSWLHPSVYLKTREGTCECEQDWVSLSAERRVWEGLDSVTAYS